MQRRIRLFPQPVYSAVNIGLKLRRVQPVCLVGPPCCVKLLAAAKITPEMSHTAHGLVLFLTAGEIESVQRRLIDAVKVNDLLITGGIFLLKFRKGAASTILKGKAAALQRNPPINGKLERLAGKDSTIVIDHNVSGQFYWLTPILIPMAQLVAIYALRHGGSVNAAFRKQCRSVKNCDLLIGHFLCVIAHLASPRSLCFFCTLCCAKNSGTSLKPMVSA